MIKKNKEYLLINIEDSKKQYRINLNDLSVIGLRGTPIKRIPEKVKRELYFSTDNLVGAVSCLLNHTYGMSHESKIKLISCYEKIYAINKNVPFYACSNYTIDLINRNFKLVSSIIREEKEISMHDIQRILEKKLFLKTYNIDNRYINYFGKDKIIEVGLYFSKEIQNLTNKELDSILSIYFFSGALEIFGSYLVRSTIVRYIRLARFFDVKTESKNWIKHCSVLDAEYKLEREKNDNAILKYNQDKKELLFENEYYKVIVPTTCAEFKLEAEQQNNCVYRLYLEKVINGETNVVFIRDKTDLNSSLITCEVRNGQIMQYLKRFNSNDLTESEKSFKEEYQQHLWGCADE